MGIKTPRKRILVPTIAAVAVLGVGGAAWAVAENDERVTDSQAQRAAEAALAEVGGGRVLETEADEDGGARYYELDVVDAAGTAWDIVLDEEFQVVVADRDDRDGDRDSRDDDRDGRDGRDHDRDDAATGESADADEQPVSAEERQRVGDAAAAAVTGGKSVDVDRSDDAGAAWEVEVRDAQGRDWDVTLDAQLAVLDTVRD